MFKLIGWLIKTSLFVLVVLIASHFVKWNGKTVSDQVKTTISSAERSPSLKAVKEKSSDLIVEIKEAAIKAKDEIPAKDRRKLQSLIETEGNRS